MRWRCQAPGSCRVLWGETEPRKVGEKRDGEGGRNASNPLMLLAQQGGVIPCSYCIRWLDMVLTAKWRRGEEKRRRGGKGQDER